MQSLIESEMQQLEEDNSPSRGEYFEGHVSEKKDLNGKERSEMINVDFGGDQDVLDLDDDDNKYLLSHQLTFSNLGG